MPISRPGGLKRGPLFDTNIPATEIDKDIFTDQEVESSIAGDDLILMLDVSETPDVIKYMTRTNFVAGLTGDTIQVSDNESTNENNLIMFVADAATSTGQQEIEMDGDFHYNPSSGTVTATTFSGALSGNATTATALAAGRTIAMTGDVAWTSASFDGSGNVTGAGTIQANAVHASMMNTDAISAQTEITSGLAAEDELLYSDGGVLKKVGLDTLVSKLAGTGLSASSGVLAVSSAYEGDIQGVTAGVGLSGGGTSGTVTVTLNLSELTDTAIAHGDYIVFTDSTDSNASVKGDLADVATLFAGTGLTATNSVIAVDASQTQITAVGTIATGVWEGTDVGVAHGGTGVSTLLTNAILTGNGASAIQAETDLLFSSNKLIPTAAAHDAAGTALTMSAGATTAGTSNNQAGGALTLQGGQGKGSGAGGAIIFQVANEGGSGSSLNSLATALTINDDSTITTAGAIELGHASDTTIARSGSGDITIEGNAVYRAGGTDVAVADGGTGSGTASGARSNLGLGTAAVAATGISNTNVPVFTSGVEDDDFLRVDGTSIEGLSAAEVAAAIEASIDAVGTIASGTWEATDVAVAHGGTGASTLTANGVLIGNGTSAVSAVDLSTKGHLIAGDGSGNPSALAVGGTGGHVLTVDSSEATGMKWAAVTAGAATSLEATSSSANEPIVEIENTHADATAGFLKFIKDPGSGQGADNDILGTITFYGTDASNNAPEELARIESYVIEADHGSEAGGMKFYVAENDATMTAGLQVLGVKDADGEIDVTIGAGAASTTTIAGTLTMGSTAAMTNAGLVAVANQSSITGLGTISSGVWEGTDVAVAHGGTGASSLTSNAVLTGNGTSAIQAETDLLFSSNKLIPTAAAHDAAGTTLTISAGATTAGTSNNQAGGALTFQGGQGKGSGAGGAITFQTANAGGSGSSLNSLATAFSIEDSGKATFAAGFDVGSDASGDVLYHNGTSYVRLAKGSDGEYLKLASGLPSWASVASAAVSALNNATADELVTVGSTTTELDAEANLTYASDVLTTASSSADLPRIDITNTHAGATAGKIRFNKDSGSGDDNDVMGTIEWYGTDAAENTHERLAYIDSYIIDSAHGSEAAGIRFYVAENDATNTLGLQILGQPDDNGEVDVTIGAGAASTTTIAGTLTMGSTAAMTNAGLLSVANQSSITGLGTISSGTWEATDVAVAHGGTGASSLTANAVLTGNGTSAIQAETDLLFASNKLIPTASAHDAAGTTLTISAGATTAGTSNNQAGGALTFQGGQGKGSGAGGAIIFQVANEGGSGSSLNSLATALTINDDSTITTAGAIELGHASDTTLARSGSGDLTIEGNAIYRAGGTDVAVADGGTGASSLTDGGVLLGSGTGAITAMAVLSDGEMIVGDGSTDPVAESGATLRTSIGVGTGDTPQFLGTTLSSSSANEPVLTITNTHADATAGYLKFIKDPGSGQGADNDIMGTITFHGTDASNNAAQELARMEAYVIEADHGSEAGGLKFYVAENDATVTAGLQILGVKDADGEIDVTIGAGAASTTIIAGTLTMGSTAAMTNAGLVSVANQSNITGLGTISSGTWEATDVGVAHGGTGASTLTANGVLIGNGTSAVTAVDLSTKGHILAGDGSGNPQALAVGGTDGHVLTVDSSEATGLKYAAASGGASSGFAIAMAMVF